MLTKVHNLLDGIFSPLSTHQTENENIISKIAKDRIGDPNIHFLGGTATLPPPELLHEGLPMQQKGDYFLEKMEITTLEGERIHTRTIALGRLAKKWISLGGIASGQTFNDFIVQKMEETPEIKNDILQHRVRYFNEDERECTIVSFTDTCLEQIGLDTVGMDPKPLQQGKYAFILGKTDLYMTPKLVTQKGKIQHSSFLKSAKVASAGTAIIDQNALLSRIQNESGHYHPTKTEMQKVLEYLKQHLPEAQFKKVTVRINKNKGWRIGVSNFFKNRFNINWNMTQEPAHIWLSKRKSNNLHD